MKTYLLALLAAGLSSVALADDDWKLLPMEHNNPGLKVDLGVGLWAWPMPMDYDGDGDIDLLVACPDKPSNGVYYFENPTQDPSVKMPAFKAGVHIGKAGHNMQVSYVDGEPTILKENLEYPDFKTAGFEKGKKIYPNAKFHGGKTRARMWRYVDWEGDGDQDLVVGVGDWSDYEWDHAYDAQGRWQNGPLHGWVYLIKNNDGKYSDKPVKVNAGGAPVDVFGWPSPNFADFDGDGDLDLLCGEFMDGFTYFENIGNRSKPEYATGMKLNATNGEPLVMHLQMITPTAFDWDGDSDLDLIVGDEDGRVALVENIGGPKIQGAPIFAQPVYFKQEADTLKFGALATPFAHDWDGDGDEDILSGNTAGNIALFENLDGKGTKWSAPELLKADDKEFRILAGPNGSIQGPAEAKWGYTTISVADWNADGTSDILVNSIWPKLQLLKNEAGVLSTEPLSFWTEESAPKFYWWTTKSENLQTQWRTTPLATDFDGDGKLDLVILDQEGYLTCQSRKTPETRIFVDEDNQPLQLNKHSAGRSGRYKLAVTDWDGDGRLDVLVNSENATWYRNCEDRDGKIVLKKVGNLAKRNVAGHTSSPTVCDFDKNGKPDLIIGAENGRLYFIKHEDCIAYSGDQIKARAAKQKDAPRFPGLVKEEFIYQKAPFPECHASTLIETSRGLVAAWFGGTKERNPDVGIWSSYNDGAGWSTPKEWANGIQHSELRYPTWNPVLFQPEDDAPLMLFFKSGPNPREWWGEVMYSYDRGRSFRDRKRLPEQMHGPVRSKAITLANGTVLCPSSTEYNEDWRFHFELLSDVSKPEVGESWKRVETKEQPFQVIQPSLLVHADGTIQALCRSKNEKIIQSFSKDNGNTWSELEATSLPNNNSGIEALTMKDGRHLLLYNHIGGGKRKDGWGKRNVINLAISEDGKEWKAAAIVEKAEKGEFSYPAMIQTKDGLVHMTYTWKRQKVRHIVIDPTKLKIQPIASFE